MLPNVLMRLEAGGRGVISVAVACGVAGIISGSITMTGLANDLINGIISVANGKLIIALLLTMLCCIVLGMGVPTTANYCIMAATCAPILVRMGVPTTGSSLLCILLWYCCRYHTAGSAGCLRRFSHSEGQSDEDCIYSFETGYRSIYCTLCILLQSGHAADRYHTAVSVVQIFITSLIGVFGSVLLTGRISCLAKMPAIVRVYAGCRRTDAYQSNAFDGYFGTASDRCRMCMAENAAE